MPPRQIPQPRRAKHDKASPFDNWLCFVKVGPGLNFRLNQLHAGLALFALLASSFLLPASSADAPLPQGVKAVWDVSKAFHESTSTRERISINGLWRWQPAEDAAQAPPTADWGYLRVPESWPERADTSPTFFPHPSWAKTRLRGVTAAWYQREVAVPREWSGRRITLYTEYLNSYAKVYLDGNPIGEMRYPSGEIDLTAACRTGSKHLLTMLVAALPLKAVMMSHADTATPRQVAGSVERRGLCGDVYLTSTPAGPRIANIKVDTSVRRWQIAFDTALDALDEKTPYVLTAQIMDGNRKIAEFTSAPFRGRDLADGRMAFTKPWHPEKLWDTHTPKNQYQLSLSLHNAGGKLLDLALPVRFGFRELWIDGRDFYLNGTRIYLSAEPIDNAQESPDRASYDGARAAIERFKSFGINFVYTHNYGCEPGAHLSFEEILKAADDEGMLVALSQPHFDHYDWKAPDADRTNGYAGHAEFYVKVAGNHPSVVFYSTSHNATGYNGDMNPDMIDGIQNPRDQWSARNAERALRAEAIIRRLDPGRIVYHHSSGNLGAMHTINFYANWAPQQEMSDWFEHWAMTGVKPLFTCEYSVPFLWDWAMYRGWYKGKREFGSAAAPWEFSVAEWDAQFLGAGAYRISEEEKKNLRWEAEQYRKGRGWMRWDYPYDLNSVVFDDRFQVVAGYLTDNWRAFRTWGVSATSPWEYDSYWKHASARDRGGEGLHLAVDWDHLQRPGPRPVYVQEDEARAKLAFHPADYQPTLAAEALYRNNMPLLAYIAGRPAAFTSKDHNFQPGETLEKQLIVLNNSRVTVTCDGEWKLELPRAIGGRTRFTLPTGEQKRVPLKFELPPDLAAGRYALRATVKFGNGETQNDSFSIDVLPKLVPLQVAAKIALFDPKGESARLLKELGIRFTPVDANADLASFDTLIVGKGALTLTNAAPDIGRVRDGLKVIVFEQTPDVLERRFGFRVAEYGLRWVFERVPGHPILAGIGEEQLRDWRGESTILPPRLTTQPGEQFNLAPTVQWAGMTVTRVWRAGNRGNVASALIEKPARGDFMPVLDGGYSLQYTPLLEYREGRGMVLLCQMDVSGRTASDPAAVVLARNILQYVAAWKPVWGRAVVYAGEPAGARYLYSEGVSPAEYEKGALWEGRLLVVGPGGGQRLAPDAADIAGWLKAGGRVLAIGLDDKDANAFLPAKISTAVREHIAAYFEPFRWGSVFAGVSPADVHCHAPRQLPLISQGADPVGDGVLAQSADARVVFCQLAPWRIDYSGEQNNIKRTFRRVSSMTSRLLANLGAAGQTPLLGRFSTPVAAHEKRWLDGFYLDTPEEWDDPYRFFRW
jgi:beta-galactosidase/beta-glucuronidase